MSMSSIDFLFFFLNKWHWHEPDYSAPGWSIFFFPGSYNHALVIDPIHFTVAVLHFQPCLSSDSFEVFEILDMGSEDIFSGPGCLAWASLYLPLHPENLPN